MGKQLADKRPISSRQAMSIVSSTILGVGVLTLPRVVASEAHEAGWIAILCGAFATSIVMIIVTKLGLRFPHLNFIETCSHVLGRDKGKSNKLGKLLSYPIIIILIAYYLVVAASISRTFGEVVVTAVLKETPLEVIIGTMLLTSLYLVKFDIDVLARLNELLLPLIVIPILLIALLSFQSFQLEFILPVWPGVSLSGFLRGVLLTMFAYQGYELILIFSNRIQIIKKSLWFNILGIIIPSVIYLLIVIAGISVFGDEELAILMWPTLEIIKVTEVPGMILERLESLFLGVWVAAVFTTTANFFYATTLLTQQVFGRGKRIWYGLGFAPLIFWLSLQPQNIIALFDFQQYIGYAGLTLGALIPAFLLIMAFIRKKGSSTGPLATKGPSAKDQSTAIQQE